MTDPEVPDSISDQPIDWNATRTRLRERITFQLGREDTSLEDLTQQAVITILRLSRRQEIRNLDGLIQVVARDTAIDEIRRRQRARARHDDWESSWRQIESLPDPSRHPWDGAEELLWFLLLEYLRQHQAPCHALAVRYAELGDWRKVAAEAGRSYVAVRQQWARCGKAFRAALKKDPGPFKEWVDGA